MTASSAYLNRPARSIEEAAPAAAKAARIREWLESGGSIHCPADPAGARCFHTACLEQGCSYQPAEGDGMSQQFDGDAA